LSARARLAVYEEVPGVDPDAAGTETGLGNATVTAGVEPEAPIPFIWNADGSQLVGNAFVNVTVRVETVIGTLVGLLNVSGRLEAVAPG
jgi:hypothetical protein